MRRLSFSVFLAAALALGVMFLWKPAPIETQLLRVQLTRQLPAYANALSVEPLELQALFLDYSSDPLLVGKARLALLRYPQMTRPVLEHYGAEPLFQQALKDYGDQAIPPIYYYLTHELASIAVRKHAEDLAASAELKWRNLWGQGTEVPQAGAQPDEPTAAMTPERRGWYAVGFILEEGHDFLGQFAVNADGDVHQIQSERVLEALNSFFAGGVRGLESRYRRSEPVELGDVGWAGVDLAVGISALKVLRMGRAARAGAGVRTSAGGLSERSAALGSSLLRGSAIGLRVAKYGAPFALGYIVLRHPSVLNALFREVAEALGAPVPLIQTVGWTLALLPLLLLAQLLLRPLAALLSVSATSLRWIESVFRGRSRSAIR
ncbi:MAG: hypothetical protein RBT39_01775 [Azoarcus sp.]|jgi:hypothetical protein|nr:hypothetical protein [Azoarcus sp.]